MEFGSLPPHLLLAEEIREPDRDCPVEGLLSGHVIDVAPLDGETAGQRPAHAEAQGEEVEVDTYMRLLPSTGKLLLCSDGLCGFVGDETIQEILEKEISLPQMVDDLYETALAAHSNDNITAVVVDFSL